ncbi:hypothetical protein GDO86_016880 [Hymenochirus boettgeri]|uniref:Nostrin n=1 Tax=Hymenochirus boettgeri TaxID=247094 RepID=A0A8T2IPF0_9PIPI|nr:hypothetical protein GDO86_016880 [Hymenochirus boettgeri]
MASSVLINWKQQIKVKKKLMDHTKKHEALFHHVGNTKQSVNEKDKQKLLNKLKKSTEILTKADEEYYKENISGQTIRLKWENVLENCYKNIQDLEKERIQLLSHILTRYNQHVLTFGQTLNVCQSQIDQAIKSIDVENDIQSFMEETSIYSEDNKSEFLLLDYYEEDGSVIMDKERRVASINMKLQRLTTDTDKALKDKEGLEKMLKAYNENPAFSDMKNEENTSVLLEETNLKLNLLEANHFKLASALAELEGRSLPSHPCSERIAKWKEKGLQHCSVHISRSINTKKFQSSESTRLTNRSNCRASRILSIEHDSESGSTDQPNKPPRGLSRRIKDLHLEGNENSHINGHGKSLCTVLYPYKPQRDDELSLKKGDHLEIHHKDEDGWWYGSLNGKKGYFPSTYVEEDTPGQTSNA